MEHIRKPITKSWILATIAALMFNLILLYQYRGVGTVCMVALSIYILYTFKVDAGIKIGMKFCLIGVYTLALSGVFMVTTVHMIRFLAGFTVWVLLFVMTFSGAKFRWVEWLKSIFISIGGALSKYIAYFKVGHKSSGRDYKYLKQILLGIVIALPVLLVALALLASADAVFNDMLERFLEFLEPYLNIKTELDIGKVIWRIMLFFFMAPFIYGLGLYIKSKVDNQAEPRVDVVVEGEEKHRFIAPAVSATVLVLLNVIYILFAYVQIRFLFFADIDTGVYDYAGYAREGFFELITLSILNTLGILFINGFTKPHIFNKIALSITVACTHIMIASSTYKMYLYESTYGYTQLRLYVYFILGFMVVFMLLITLNIWQPTYRVIEWAIVIGLCYFLVISYVNVDDIIVKRNIEHYDDPADIDLYYLTTLSEDAMPRLIEFMNESQEIEWSSRELHSYEDCLKWIDRKRENRSFLEYNIRYQKAYKAVEKDLLFNN